MNQKHTYEYDIDLKSDVAPARVIRMITPGARVLEIGAGPGSITRHLTGMLGCSVVALEVDPAAIEILQQYVPKIHSADLNYPGWSDLIRAEDGLFDFVIAADVLEHVYDPWKVLAGMKSLLNENGRVVLSLPHVGHAAIAACLIDEDFEYRPWGLLDRTHIRFFGIKNMQALINDAGLAIEKAEFVVRTPLMTEFAIRWRRLPRAIRSALQHNRYSHVFQVVSSSRVKSDGQTGIDLLTLTPEPPEMPVVAYWTRVMRDQSGDKTDLRSPLERRPIAAPRPTLMGRVEKAMRKLKKRID